jgi:hypothetical protein
MTTPPTFPILPEAGPVLFADCPFCLAPLPFDLASGSMDCPDCAVHLELAPEPVSLPVTMAAPPAVLVPAA